MAKEAHARQAHHNKYRLLHYLENYSAKLRISTAPKNPYFMGIFIFVVTNSHIIRNERLFGLYRLLEGEYTFDYVRYKNGYIGYRQKQILLSSKYSPPRNADTGPCPP